MFLIVFFLLYGWVHLYFYRKLTGAFSLSSLASAITVTFLVIMVLAPVLVRLAERQGMEATGRTLAVVGYVWMGLLFLFFSLAVVLDLYRGGLFLAGKLFHADYGGYLFSSRGNFLLAFGWGCIISLYGAYEARNIRTERIELRTSKLPPGMKKFTIVQISDIHLGLMVRNNRVTRIIELVRAADPDVLVSTGDLVDGQLDGLTDLAQRFRLVQTRYGKFAVTGNHEFYAGLKSSLLLTRQAGFSILRNEAVQIAGGVTFVGVDDPAAKRHGDAAAVAESELLLQQPSGNYKILLKHRPAVAPQSFGKFDLQLSGHVHKGQIFPFNLLTYLFYPVKVGLTRLAPDSFIYVSRGTGTWGPPIRFLAPPEVTVIELIPAPADM